MRLLTLLGCALLCACTRATPTKAPVSPAAPAVKATAARSTLFELPSLGVQLQAPCAMELVEHEQHVQDGPMHMRGAGCTDGTQAYAIARFFRDGRDRAKDDAMLANSRKELRSVSREALGTMGEWACVDVEGVGSDGQNAWLRTVAVGDGFWIFRVGREKGPLDHDRARAFLDSIVLEQTWSERAFPEAHVSVLLPDGAVNVGSKALHGEDFTLAHGSWLGGKENRMFFIWSKPVSGDASVEQRMDAAQAALIDRGNRLIWQAPLEVDGARGRDFLMQSRDSWMRLRIVVTDTELFLLQASAASKDALLDPSVPRFLSSLRWFTS